ncbi:MAG: HdeD family acid-resistance protein [Candidatus Eremiobacteraeota bacterium]|nr:HdeD family acid-resistance protein [Candidatus Eremiobacteraeota bacterium]
MTQAIAGLPGVQALKEHWWALLIRGIVAILFGIVCFAETGAAIYALVLIIGAFFVIDGVLMVVGAIRSSSASNTAQWWWQIIGGIVGIAAGVLTFMWPGITALTLTIFVGAWAIVTGIFELMTAIRLRKVIPNEWLWIINGILSIILGVLIFMYPGGGIVALTWLLGFYAILAGITMLALAFRLRGLAHNVGVA